MSRDLSAERQWNRHASWNPPPTIWPRGAGRSPTPRSFTIPRRAAGVSAGKSTTSRKRRKSCPIAALKLPCSSPASPETPPNLPASACRMAMIWSSPLAATAPTTKWSTVSPAAAYRSLFCPAAPQISWRKSWAFPGTFAVPPNSSPERVRSASRSAAWNTCLDRRNFPEMALPRATFSAWAAPARMGRLCIRWIWA